MDKEPATSVHEGTGVSAGEVTLTTGNHHVEVHLTWGEEVNARDRLVADSHLSLDRADVESLEASEVLEEGAVRRANGKFDTGELGNNGEHACGRVHKHH